MSTSDQLFKLANKSVDEMLNEISAHSPKQDAGLAISKTGLTEQASTEPLQFHSPERAKAHLSGPRTPIKSSPRRHIMIADAPAVVTYTPLSEPESEDELVSICEADRVDVHWNSVPAVIKSSDSSIIKEIHATGKPLPSITNSSSVQSMPNMITNPLDEFDSDDSEETIAASPHTQSLGTYLQKQPAVINNCPNLAYDHDQYMEQVQRGEVKETPDVKSNRQYREQVKQDIRPSKKAAETTQVDKAIEGLGDLYDTNITNTDGDTLKIKRNGSVKSTMSISSGDRQLETKLVDKQLPSVDLKEGIQGFTDDEVNGILDQQIKPEKRGSKSHSRSSSITHMVGKFIRSVSSRSLSSKNNQKDSIQKESNQRVVSNRSVATTLTTESDFVSASEGEYDNDDDEIDLITMDSDATTRIHRDEHVSDKQVADDTMQQESKESTPILAPTETDTLVPIESLSAPQSLKQDAVASKKVAATSVQPVQPVESVPVLPVSSSTPATSRNVSTASAKSSDSFAPDKFVLDVPELGDHDLFDGTVSNTDDSVDRSLSGSYLSTRRSTNSQLNRLGGNGESSGMDEMLNIWSKQDSFRNVSNHSDDFQCMTPRSASRFIVRSKSPKCVRVVSDATVGSKLKVAEAKKVEPVEAKAVEAEVATPVESKPEVAEVDTQVKTVEVPVEVKSVQPEVQSIEEQIPINMQPIVNNTAAQQAALVDEELVTRDLEIAAQLANVDLSDVLDKDLTDDSFLKDIESWENPVPRATPAPEELPGTDKDVSELWRNGTLSKKSRLVSQNENDIQPIHMSANEVEEFMIHKQMTSEKFEIKKANGTAVIQNYVPVKNEQRGETVHSDIGSVADLGIPTGIKNEVRVETPESLQSQIFADAQETQAADDLQKRPSMLRMSPGPEPSTPQRQSAASRYGNLVPEARKAISPVKNTPSPVKKAVMVSGGPLDDPTEKVNSDLVNGEKGRMFLRLNELKDLNLPDIEKRDAKFQAVLDNGIHVLTTDLFEIGQKKTIPIDKEFEFIVGEKLDIVMTLKLKYNQMQDQLVEVKERKKVKSKNKFARCFGAKTIVTTTKYVNRPAEQDPLADVCGTDGSFAKFNISFDDYRSRMECKPVNIALEGQNEWKSKGGRPRPFHVCTMDTQMLFIPRKSQYEVLPTSIKSAVSEVQEVTNATKSQHEGYMFQEGGDLTVYTRRFFKLNGYDMFAYNNSTMKLKAKINVKRVVEIQYPGKKDTTVAQVVKKKRDRVISETLILNDGFKLVFSNDETIDFGCDSRKERDEWISVLEDLITKNNFRRQPWVKQMSRVMA